VKYYHLICSFFLFLASICRADPQVLDGVAAMVNDTPVTFSQVRELTTMLENSARANFAGAELTEKIKEIRLRAVNDLIDRELILHEFRKLKGSVPPFIVEDRINLIVRDDFGGDRTAFLKTIANQGYTMDRIRKIEEEKWIIQAMRQREMKGAEPIVPAGRVEAFYREHIKEWTQGDEVKLRMLKISGGTEPEKKRKMIEEIREKVVRGADFSDMARIYSEDSNQDKSGDWGWVKKGDLNPVMERSVFSLTKGKVSEVLTLEGNYYLLLAEDAKPGTVKPLSELRGDIERHLKQEESQKMQQGWISRLRQKAYIKIY
jgi:peptidyl-prolyl cis-trans isomerase SurA